MATTDALGPFVQVAVFCDDVMQESNGRLTVLRLVTEVNVEAAGDDPPEVMPTVPVSLTMLLVVNGGGKPGVYEASVDVIAPNGRTRTAQGQSEIDLKHEYFTANVIIKTTIPIDLPGVYWFVVRLAGRETVRLPLNVTYTSTRNLRTEPDETEARSAGPKPPSQSTH